MSAVGQTSSKTTIRRSEVLITNGKLPAPKEYRDRHTSGGGCLGGKERWKLQFGRSQPLMKEQPNNPTAKLRKAPGVSAVTYVDARQF